MNYPRTLRARITLYFCVYLAVILIVYSAAMIGIFRLAEDLTHNRHLAEISEKIAQHVVSHGAMPTYLPPHITAYQGFQGVPKPLQEFVRNRHPGLFEINTYDFNLHAALVPMTSTGQVLYVFYDVGSVEASEGLEWLAKLALLGAGMGVLLLGWLLARSLSNRILVPIFKLAEAVRSLGVQKENARLDYDPTPDEVGVLAETVDHLLIRISEFTRREREFTAHASHELRTPASVIRGAVEILESRIGDDQIKIKAPLERIDRAVMEIERLIDTFLLLARKEQIPDQNDTCDLREVVTEVVASHRYLLGSKPVEVKTDTADSGSVRAPAALVTIAIGNLVRNAFQYTTRGRIEIIALGDRVSVRDSGPGIDAAKQKIGVGLTIVKRLCERMKWQFTISESAEGGTRADLVFTSSETERPEADRAPAPM